MPDYMLILRDDTTKDFSAIGPEQFAGILAEYRAWSARVAASGNLRFGHKLKDGQGRVLAPDPSGARVLAKDGPYVETKEVVGGFYVVAARDHDHAAELCAGHPHFRFGSIEIREIDPMTGDGA
jgi:hypothetical protein